MSYGGIFLAVTTSAEAVTSKYGGNFSAVGGFSFFGGNDFGGGATTKYGGKLPYFRFRPPGR